MNHRSGRTTGRPFVIGAVSLMSLAGACRDNGTASTTSPTTGPAATGSEEDSAYNVAYQTCHAVRAGQVEDTMAIDADPETNPAGYAQEYGALNYRDDLEPHGTQGCLDGLNDAANGEPPQTPT